MVPWRGSGVVYHDITLEWVINPLPLFDQLQ